MKIVLVCLMLNVPVNNFSHVNSEPPLPGYYKYFWGVNISCSRTQHGDPGGARTPDLRGSGVRGVNHQAAAPPLGENDRILRVSKFRWKIITYLP